MNKLQNTDVRDPLALSSHQQHCSDMIHACRALLCDSPGGRKVDEIYGSALRDLDRLQTNGAQSIASLAIIGHVGEGKTWLARCFFVNPEEDSHTLAELRSGQHEDTQHATWIGPEKPAGAERAIFIRCKSESLIDLGRTYVVCDTPGFSHTRAKCREDASGALVDSHIKLLVTSLESLRDGLTESLLRLCEGAIVVPVIRLPTGDTDAVEPSTQARATVTRALEKWTRLAPESQIHEPLFMPNEHKVGTDAAARTVRVRLKKILTPLIADVGSIRTSVVAQMDHRLVHADIDAMAHLKDILEKASPSLQRLDDATRHLSEESLRELVGDDASLKAVVRQELRKAWIERTWDGFFPYKPFLRTLALTAGAWDRLLFLSTGSLPSLAMTALQVGKNIQDGWKFAQRFNSRLARRLESSLVDRLQPDLRLLVAATTPSGGDNTSQAYRQPDVRVFGIEELQDWSRGLFNAIVERYSARKPIITGCGVVAMGSFLLLVATPVLSVFCAYVWSCVHAFSLGFSTLDYALPTLSMLLGVATLSATPSIVIAWIALLIACTSARVCGAVGDALNEHRCEIARRLADKRLRFEVVDPRITALRRLLATRLMTQCENNPGSDSGVS